MRIDRLSFHQQSADLNARQSLTTVAAYLGAAESGGTSAVIAWNRIADFVARREGLINPRHQVQSADSTAAF